MRSLLPHSSSERVVTMERVGTESLLSVCTEKAPRYGDRFHGSGE